MKFKWLFVLGGSALLLLALASCGGSGTTACPSANLQAPLLAGPEMWSVEASLSPTLTWSYPDSSCSPQGYNVKLSTGPLFTDNLGGSTGSSTTSWTPGSPLQPGKEYAWSIQAVGDTTSGPFAGDSYFFTGPVCDSSSLSSPDLIQPGDNSVIDTLDPTYLWQYPDACLPGGYKIFLSTDAAFTGTPLGEAEIGNPSTHWADWIPLTDCTEYFWKVSPVSGASIGSSSEVFNFSTNVTGVCPSPTPAASPTPEAPTLTPTPEQLTFTTTINAYCLFGPDRSFKVLEIAMMGQPYLMEGRDADNRWYRIKLSDRMSCWVSIFAGKPSSDPIVLPVLPEIPLPTPTPIDCTVQKDPGTCEAFSFCKWYVTGVDLADGYCDWR